MNATIQPDIESGVRLSFRLVDVFSLAVRALTLACPEPPHPYEIDVHPCGCRGCGARVALA